MGGDITRANVVDETTILQHLRRLNSSVDPTNWVLMGYGQGKNDIVFCGSGRGGLEEFKQHLRDDQVNFGVLEVIVKGDAYNPVKHVFFTWIGSEVPAGISKARSAAHHKEILDMVKKAVGISCEYQTSLLSEVDYDPIAHAITRMSSTYHTSTDPTAQRQAMSSSHGRAGGAKSKLILVDREAAEAALREVFEGRADWCILAYVEGKKDEVELIGTGGGGVQGLRAQFPRDRIYFCLLTMKLQATGSRDKVTKYIVVTLIGPDVKPLQKARSGGQRQEITDFILSVVPVHTHFQPNDASELTEAAILAKFSDT